MPERKITYQVLQKGQSMGLQVEAPSYARLFTECALAINDYRVSLDLVKDKEQRKLTASGDSLEALLRDWLEKVVGLFVQERFLAVRVVCTRFEPSLLEATLCGELYEPTRHGFARNFESLTEGVAIELGESDSGQGFRVLFCVR